MTREQIEQAALKCAKDRCGDSESQHAMAKAQGTVYGFKQGAQWRVNSVWHDASEMPKFKGKVEKEMFMLFCNSKKYGLMLISQDEWDDFVERGMFHKWAYVDDLLPERKEDAE